MFLHRLKLPRLALLFGAITRRAASVQVFASPDSLSTAIPIECRTALSNNITCPAPLINANRLLSGEATNDTFAEQYCDCSCTDSLKSWSSDVKEKCGNRSYPFNNDLNLTASAITEPLLWAQNVTCLTDKDDCSQYCLAEITSSTAKECSDCNFQYQASILGSKYGNRRVDEQSFTSLLSSCGANPSDYPHSTFTADPRPPYPTNFPVITCNMGDQYEVCEGDTCQSIADKFGVSLDRFLYQNGLDFQCSYLQIGSKVCITDCCELHTVAENETCRNILKGKSFGQTELVAWNPVLHRDCDNIGALKGRTICISPPGTNSYDVDINVTWNVTWTLPGPWIAGPTSGSDAPESALKGYWRAIPTLTLEGGGPATLIDDLKTTPTE